MDLLAIETAASVCGIALFKGGEFQGSVESQVGREHAEKLPLFYEELRTTYDFDLSQLGGIAVSIGPGSFTGLRIGLSYGKGLAYSAGIPLVPVPTLKSMALGTGIGDGEVRCLLFSHKNTVYCQDFRMSDGYPHEQGAARSVTWQEGVANRPEGHSIFHYGCERILEKESGVEAAGAVLSARHVGMISIRDYEQLSIVDFSRVVPDYISPFKTTGSG